MEYLPQNISPDEMQEIKMSWEAQFVSSESFLAMATSSKDTVFSSTFGEDFLLLLLVNIEPHLLGGT